MLPASSGSHQSQQNGKPPEHHELRTSWQQSYFTLQLLPIVSHVACFLLTFIS